MFRRIVPSDRDGREAVLSTEPGTQLVPSQYASSRLEEFEGARNMGGGGQVMCNVTPLRSQTLPGSQVTLSMRRTA